MSIRGSVSPRVEREGPLEVFIAPPPWSAADESGNFVSIVVMIRGSHRGEAGGFRGGGRMSVLGAGVSDG